MDPGLWEVFEATGPDEVQAIIRLADPTVVPAGVRLVAQFGDIITCRLSRQAIVEVRTSGATASMKPAVRLLEELEQSTTPAEDVSQEPTDRRPASITQTGKGVVLGFVDWGLDFAHPDFRKEDGATRLIALWDQQSDVNHPVNNPDGDGRVHRRQDIDRALRETDPYAALGYRPSDADVDHSGTHGTHVAGIAAGNGRAGGPLGLAPDADIVFVHPGGEGPAALASLGNSVTLLEAVDFIARTAGDKPWVVNLSLGQQGGSHDGTSLAEQALDNLISDAPGRAIAQSCGNYCNRRIHAAGKLRPGEERMLHFDVANTELVPNKVEVWYSKRDRITVSVGVPDGTTSEVVGQGERELLTTAGKPIGRLYHRAHDPNNGDHQIALFIYPDSPRGQWTMKLTGEDVLDGRFNAWIERNTFCPNCQPHFVPNDAVELSTTGTICNGHRTIAVGAYDS